MTEPTIEQLIANVVQHSGDITLAKGSKFAIARSALLSRISEMQKEAEEWHKVAKKLAAWIDVDWCTEANNAYLEYAALTQRYEKEVKE